MKAALGIIIGGVIGYTIGYFGRCSTGACPMTSNPVVSAVIGASLGALITLSR
ncbi:MAG: DUF6132 family protein [Candidatus Omnitrophota bacterium]